MEKYGTYTIYFCPEADEYYQIPATGEQRDEMLAKIASENLTLIEVEETNAIKNKVRIIQLR